MLPVESGAIGGCSGIVLPRLDTSRENGGDAGAVATAIGSEDARGRGRAVRAHAWRGRTHQLSDCAAGRRRAARPGDRLVGTTRTAPGAQSAAAVPSRGTGWIVASQSARPSGAGPAE